MKGQEINEAIAKWRGFEKRGRSYTGKELWVSPSDIKTFDEAIKDIDKNGYSRMPHEADYYKVPDFTTDLNAWNEWVFPKLDKTEYRIMIHRLTKGWSVNFIWLADIGYKRRQRVTNSEYESVDKSLPRALCKALLKLIDGDTNVDG